MIIDTKHKNKFNYMSIMTALDTYKERFNILKPLKNSKNIVIGSFAFNRQMPLTLHQKLPLTDIDIKSDKPKRLALTIERSLDKSVGFNNYFISILKHDSGRTFRIHSRARNTVVADISTKNKRIPFRRIDSVKYETIAHRKQEVKKMLKDPKAQYRRDKEQRMMGYINRYYDSDNDGVPNWRDCKPFDSTQTGIFHNIAEKFRNLGNAGNIQQRKERLREERQEEYLQYGIRGRPDIRPTNLRPVNYHISYPPQHYHLHRDTIDDHSELLRRLEETRVKELMNQNLTAPEAQEIVEQELHPEFDSYAHEIMNPERRLWTKYRPVTKEMCFSHFPNRV